MDIEQIKTIADIFEKKGLTYFEICEGDKKLCLKKEPYGKMRTINIPTEKQYTDAKFEPASSEKPEPNEKQESPDTINITSPLAGVFYITPAPEAKPFVKVGDRVKKGDVLCIIEAMKVMNELNADTDGEVLEICVQNGQIVEYNQTLIKIKK